MSTTLRRVRRARRDPAALASLAESAILSGPFGTRGLAGELGVSVATLTRLLVSLRKDLARRGRELLSVRKGRRWHYEIRETDDRVDRALKRFILPADLPVLVRGSIKDELYGPVAPHLRDPKLP